MGRQDAIVSNGEVLRVLLNVTQGPGQDPTTKNDPVPNAHSAKAEQPSTRESICAKSKKGNK